MSASSTRLIGSIVLPDKILEGTIHVQDGKIVAYRRGFSTGYA